MTGVGLEITPDSYVSFQMKHSKKLSIYLARSGASMKIIFSRNKLLAWKLMLSQHRGCLSGWNTYNELLTFTYSRCGSRRYKVVPLPYCIQKMEKNYQKYKHCITCMTIALDFSLVFWYTIACRTLSIV